MEGNEESFWDKAKGVIAIISCICTITGFSIYGIVKEISNNNSSNEPTVTEKFFSEEQKRVSYYVPLCKTKIIPIEEWGKCTKKELYYIRNGIYAYEGMRFEKDYYKAFDWYNGTIDRKNFKDGSLNFYQNKNITNIQNAEKMKESEK